MSTDNNFPCIVSFQASDLTELSVPICFSWSLSDGQLKSVSIIPEDDWVDGIDQGTFNIDDLYDFGVTAQDLIKELNQDCDKQVIYSTDPNWLDDVLNCLYTCIDQDHPFQVESIYTLFEDKELQEIADLSREKALELGLDTHTPEDQVTLWLHMLESIN